MNGGTVFSDDSDDEDFGHQTNPGPQRERGEHRPSINIFSSDDEPERPPDDNVEEQAPGPGQHRTSTNIFSSESENDRENDPAPLNKKSLGNIFSSDSEHPTPLNRVAVNKAKQSKGTLGNIFSSDSEHPTPLNRVAVNKAPLNNFSSDEDGFQALAPRIEPTRRQNRSLQDEIGHPMVFSDSEESFTPDTMRKTKSSKTVPLEEKIKLEQELEYLAMRLEDTRAQDFREMANEVERAQSKMRDASDEYEDLAKDHARLKEASKASQLRIQQLTRQVENLEPEAKQLREQVQYLSERSAGPIFRGSTSNEPGEGRQRVTRFSDPDGQGRKRETRFSDSNIEVISFSGEDEHENKGSADGLADDSEYSAGLLGASLTGRSTSTASGGGRQRSGSSETVVDKETLTLRAQLKEETGIVESLRAEKHNFQEELSEMGSKTERSIERTNESFKTRVDEVKSEAAKFKVAHDEAVLKYQAQSQEIEALHTEADVLKIQIDKRIEKWLDKRIECEQELQERTEKLGEQESQTRFYEDNCRRLTERVSTCQEAAEVAEDQLDGRHRQQEESQRENSLVNKRLESERDQLRAEFAEQRSVHERKLEECRKSEKGLENQLHALRKETESRQDDALDKATLEIERKDKELQDLIAHQDSVAAAFQEECQEREQRYKQEYELLSKERHRLEVVLEEQTVSHQDAMNQPTIGRKSTGNISDEELSRLGVYDDPEDAFSRRPRSHRSLKGSIESLFRHGSQLSVIESDVKDHLENERAMLKLEGEQEAELRKKAEEEIAEVLHQRQLSAEQVEEAKVVVAEEAAQVQQHRNHLLEEQAELTKRAFAENEEVQQHRQRWMAEEHQDLHWRTEIMADEALAQVQQLQQRWSVEERDEIQRGQEAMADEVRQQRNQLLKESAELKRMALAEADEVQQQGNHLLEERAELQRMALAEADEVQGELQAEIQRLAEVANVAEAELRKRADAADEFLQVQQDRLLLEKQYAELKTTAEEHGKLATRVQAEVAEVQEQKLILEQEHAEFKTRAESEIAQAGGLVTILRTELAVQEAEAQKTPLHLQAEMEQRLSQSEAQHEAAGKEVSFLRNRLREEEQQCEQQQRQQQQQRSPPGECALCLPFSEEQLAWALKRTQASSKWLFSMPTACVELYAALHPEAALGGDEIHETARQIVQAAVAEALVCSGVDAADVEAEIAWADRLHCAVRIRSCRSVQAVAEALRHAVHGEIEAGSSMRSILVQLGATLAEVRVEPRWPIERLQAEVEFEYGYKLSDVHLHKLTSAVSECHKVYGKAWEQTELRETPQALESLIFRGCAHRLDGQLQLKEDEGLNGRRQSIMEDLNKQGATSLRGLLEDAAVAQLQLKASLAPGTAWARTDLRNIHQVPEGHVFRTWQSGPRDPLPSGEHYDPGVEDEDKLLERIKSRRQILEADPISTQMLDVSRLLVAFDSADCLRRSVDWLLANHDVLWVDNLFRNPSCLGCRDVSIGVQQQVAAAGGRSHISELRLTLRELYETDKGEGRTAYEGLRSTLEQCGVRHEDVDGVCKLFLRVLDCTDCKLLSDLTRSLRLCTLSLKAHQEAAADAQLHADLVIQIQQEVDAQCRAAGINEQVIAHVKDTAIAASRQNQPRQANAAEARCHQLEQLLVACKADKSQLMEEIRRLTDGISKAGHDNIQVQQLQFALDEIVQARDQSRQAEELSTANLEQKLRDSCESSERACQNVSAVEAHARSLQEELQELESKASPVNGRGMTLQNGMPAEPVAGYIGAPRACTAGGELSAIPIHGHVADTALHHLAPSGRGVLRSNSPRERKRLASLAQSTAAAVQTLLRQVRSLHDARAVLADGGLEDGVSIGGNQLRAVHALEQQTDQLEHTNHQWASSLAGRSHLSLPGWTRGEANDDASRISCGRGLSDSAVHWGSSVDNTSTDLSSPLAPPGPAINSALEQTARRLESLHGRLSPFLEPATIKTG